MNEFDGRYFCPNCETEMVYVEEDFGSQDGQEIISVLWCPTCKRTLNQINKENEI